MNEPFNKKPSVGWMLANTAIGPIMLFSYYHFGRDVFLFILCLLASLNAICIYTLELKHYYYSKLYGPEVEE